MKKLVLVVAMFMFVCGGSFFATAQESTSVAQAGVVAVNDTVVPDTTKTEVGGILPSADLTVVNDTVVPDTTKKAN